MTCGGLCCSWVAVFRVMIVLFKDVEEALAGQDFNGTIRILKSYQASRLAVEFPELDDGMTTPCASVASEAASPTIPGTFPEFVDSIFGSVSSGVQTAMTGFNAWLNGFSDDATPSAFRVCVVCCVSLFLSVVRWWWRAPGERSAGAGSSVEDADEWCRVKFLASPPEDLVIRSRSVGVTHEEVDRLRGEALSSAENNDEK
jgi:hypothetical protein